MTSCSSPQELPREFTPIPDSFDARSDEKGVQDLTQKISNIRNYLRGIPSDYKGKCITRTVVIAIMLVGVAIGALALNGSLTTFPTHFVHYFQNVNWINAVCGLEILIVCTLMATILIHRVIHKKDRITEAPLGKLSGDDQWISAVYVREDFGNLLVPGYIDISTLNEEGSGKAYMYAYKDEQNHTAVSIVVTVFTPLHMIGAIAYNAIRFFVIPFYILGCMAIEKASGAPLDDEDRPFRLSDIPNEMVNSFLRICQAPFYAVAIIFASLYSFCDPLNGRKLGSALERDWNDDVSRAEGFWSVQGPQSLWQFEGGGSPSGLGKNGFYLAGCWQPMAVVNYEKGKIVSGVSLSKAVNPQKGKSYQIITKDLLAQQHNLLVDQLTLL